MHRFFASLCLLVFIQTQGYALSVDDLSLEEKVGQLFMVYFDGEEINEEAKRLIKEVRVGSFIYYRWANRLKDPYQVQSLSNRLQAFAKANNLPPLFIAIDEEGGAVSRLGNGFTDFPGNGALGQTEDLDLVYQSAEAIGKELKAVGINYNLAPVVDINNNPNNPIIGIRSFGNTPEKVTLFGERALKGYLNSGVIPCLKHFPGHGDVRVDSHEDLPVVEKSLSALEAMELLPYMHLAKETLTLMTAHILFLNLDPHHPATLSKKILGDILRKKLGYKGVIITDSLTMEGVLKGVKNIEEAALMAFEAGNDILLIGGRSLQAQKEGKGNVDEVVSIYKAFLKAVKEGRISEERVNQSVERILALKQSSGLFDETPPIANDIKKNCATKNHLKLAKEIAYRSVAIKKGDFPLYLKLKSISVIAPHFLKDKIPFTDLIEAAEETHFSFYGDDGPSQREENAILKNTAHSDCIIFFSYNAWKHDQHIAFLKTIAKQTHLVLIATGEVNDLKLVPRARLQIATYSPSIPSLIVATEIITGKALPLYLSPQEALELWKKIWNNECNRERSMLTFWKEGEEFPSMGIGHFIWPPQPYSGPFSKGVFPEFLTFLHRKNVILPSWLERAHFSPWTSREEFYRETDSSKMKELRELLNKTIPLQASFMVEKLNQAFLEMQHSLSLSERRHLITQFFRIARTPQGPYILIDYLNFKHAGTDPKERYNEKGWGLLQVLQMMGDSTSKDPIEDFIDCAKKLLKERIKNSPPERNESRWWKGWENRLNTYKQSLLGNERKTPKEQNG